MPSTYAHRRFGAQVLCELPAPLQAVIARNRQLYDIGLHGPDLLFYYHAVSSNPVNRLGNAMHNQPGRVFFERAREVVRSAAHPEAALAYALGFICHFALDSTCHPFVEQYARQSGVSHCEIETEFENALMQQDGEDPQRFFAASHICPSRENAAAIAPFYEGITEQQAYRAQTGMVFMLRLLWVTNPLKRRVVLAGMKLVGKYDSLHGLVANPVPNPACAASSQRLTELYEQAKPLAVRLIVEYATALESGAPLDAVYEHTFGEI